MVKRVALTLLLTVISLLSTGCYDPAPLGNGFKLIWADVGLYAVECEDGHQAGVLVESLAPVPGLGYIAVRGVKKQSDDMSAWVLVKTCSDREFFDSPEDLEQHLKDTLGWSGDTLAYDDPRNVIERGGFEP